ncbi:hypothetical protein [Nocardiopsis deserti]|uniref:hypothetical protein n=1 Tax=Nocardiopsis deserti TaxID=2605988 RepID=UPI00123BB917|nr:hypothetical protein [Nocardiopsis deserti]
MSKRLEQIRARSGSADTAAAALNLAALMASDCGMPDLARDLCLRQARVFFSNSQSFDVPTAKLALQPLINLGRLHTRAGSADRAHSLFTTLFEAARTSAAITAENLEVDFAGLTRGQDEHQEIVRWLWTVLLSDGTRALASAGRWPEAFDHVRRHNGVGSRLLDGRQIAVLAHSAAGEHDQALAVIEQTEAQEPWENMVASVLRVLCLSRAHRNTEQAVSMMADCYMASSGGPENFRVQAGTCVIALSAGFTKQEKVTEALIGKAATTRDAHVARELLAQETGRALAPEQREHLQKLVQDSALGEETLPDAVLAELLSAAEECTNHLKVLTT